MIYTIYLNNQLLLLQYTTIPPLHNQQRTKNPFWIYRYTVKAVYIYYVPLWIIFCHPPKKQLKKQTRVFDFVPLLTGKKLRTKKILNNRAL